VDCWVIHPSPLDFHGTGGRGRCPWPCQHMPLSRTGADGPQAEERAIAADSHCIDRVPCDNFLFFVFLAEALKKHGLGPPKSQIVGFYSNSLKYPLTVSSTRRYFEMQSVLPYSTVFTGFCPLLNFDTYYLTNTQNLTPQTKTNGEN
jgi:hypothetical protein